MNKQTGGLIAITIGVLLIYGGASGRLTNALGVLFGKSTEPVTPKSEEKPKDISGPEIPTDGGAGEPAMLSVGGRGLVSSLTHNGRMATVGSGSV